MSDVMWMMGTIVVGIVLFIIGYLLGSRQVIKDLIQSEEPKKENGKERETEDKPYTQRGRSEALGEKGIDEGPDQTAFLREEMETLMKKLAAAEQGQRELEEKLALATKERFDLAVAVDSQEEEVGKLEKTIEEQKMRLRQLQNVRGHQDMRMEELRDVKKKQVKAIKDLMKASKIEENGLDEASKLIRTLMGQLEDMKTRYEQLEHVVESQNEMLEQVNEETTD